MQPYEPGQRTSPPPAPAYGWRSRRRRLSPLIVGLTVLAVAVVGWTGVAFLNSVGVL
jgi:hypothetical protein